MLDFETFYDNVIHGKLAESKPKSTGSIGEKFTATIAMPIRISISVYRLREVQQYYNWIEIWLLQMAK